MSEASKPRYTSQEQYLYFGGRLLAECPDVRNAMELRDLLNAGQDRQARVSQLEAEGWTCFHCGERFTTPGAAEAHFGGKQYALAGCQIKAGEERGLLMQLRKAEKERDDWEDRAKISEINIDRCGRVADIQNYKPFRKCDRELDAPNGSSLELGTSQPQEKK